MTKLSFIVLLLIFTASADDLTIPGGVYGGHYMKWGQSPFVERVVPPEPGGVFEGVPYH
jgi:hypothetical protein